MKQGPLRYPGAKWRLAQTVQHFLELHCLVGREMIEPFGGSAAVGRALLYRKTISRLTIVERDPLVAAFWKAVKIQSEDLIERVLGCEISIYFYDHVKNNLSISEDLVDRAFACLYLNRTNFSGILNAGPIGGRQQSSDYKLDCRFNRLSLIEDLRFWYKYADSINVVEGDGISYISSSERDDLFIYVDPPYFTNGRKFYPKFFQTIEHYRLRKTLMSCKTPWLLSYDRNSKVQYLYRERHVCPIEIYNSAKGSGKKGELLVSNYSFSRDGRDRHLVGLSHNGVSTAI